MTVGLEALATVLIGLLAEKTTDRGLFWPIVMTLCWTMGLQNALITKVTDAQIRTTHVTGMVTDIGIDSARCSIGIARTAPIRCAPARTDCSFTP
ncbi:YoaK family protein [Propioniferax innocua]|uniref:DUF1275 family protein n=1 Tax=Propioniferax innocua TaxID=1753 RepID=UPI0011542A26